MVRDMLIWHHEITGFPHSRECAVKAGIGQTDLYGGYNLGHKQPRKKYFQYIHFRQHSQMGGGDLSACACLQQTGGDAQAQAGKSQFKFGIMLCFKTSSSAYASGISYVFSDLFLIGVTCKLDIIVQAPCQLIN